MQYSHKHWMKKALDLLQFTSSNVQETNEVPVAALLVKNDVVLAQATNLVEKANDATAHAEMLVIREASKILCNWRLKGCILYTTLEPCSMCMGAIVNSRISKLVFGAYDLNAGACGSALNIVTGLKKENQLDVIGGICEEESSLILKDFFKEKREVII